MDDSLYEILVGQDLVEPRLPPELEPEPLTLDPFIDDYIESRTDVTERRRGKLRVAKRRIVKFLGDVDMKEVSPDHADRYARHLLKNLAPATAQKECQVAAQFFRHA